MTGAVRVLPGWTGLVDHATATRALHARSRQVGGCRWDYWLLSAASRAVYPIDDDDGWRACIACLLAGWLACLLAALSTLSYSNLT